MTKTRSTEESEAFAKNWQVDAISVQVTNNETARQKDNEELKDLIKSVGSAVNASGFVTTKQLEAELKLIAEKYDPLKKGVFWLAGAVVAIIISIGFNLFINIAINGAGK